MTSRLDASYAVVRRTGVPSGWREKQVSDLVRVVGGGTPDRDESAYWRDGGIPWITPTDLTANAGKYIREGAEHISEAGLANSNARLVPVGSIVFSTRGTVGNLAIAGVPLTANQSCEVLVPRDGSVDSEFLYYLLNYGMFAFHRLAGGTTFGAITRREIGRVWLAMPEGNEQTAIARVLDAVDAAIDRAREAVRAVEKLRRGLMQELLPPWIGFKRVESEALSTGVDGIEIARDVCDVCNGSTPSRTEGRYWRNGSIAWLPTGKVHDRIIRHADEFVTDAALRECSISILPKGTVLVGMIGQGRTRGMAAYLDIEACINQNFGAFVPREIVSGKWLFHYFDYHYGRLREVGGGTNQGALNCFLLKRLRLPLPSMARQLEVAAILDAIESLSEASRAKVERLGELKKSLMHDLLTGSVRVDPVLFKQEATA